MADAYDLLTKYLQWWTGLCRQFGRRPEDEASTILGLFDRKDRHKKIIPKHVHHMLQLMRHETSSIVGHNKENKKKFLSALLLSCYDPNVNRPMTERKRKYQQGLILPWLVDASTLLEIYKENNCVHDT